MMLIAATLLALGAGVWMGVELNQETAEQRDLDALHALSRESALLDEGVKARIESLRASAFRAARQTAQEPFLDASGPLLHWASLELAPQATPVIKRALRREGFENTAPATLAAEQGRLEQRYLAFLAENVKNLGFSESGVSAIPFQFDLQGRREWLALVFTDQELPDGHATALAVLVDPAEVFAGFREIGKPASADKNDKIAIQQADARRAYLITDDGNVLAHSKASYVGSDLSSTSIYQKALRSIFDGSRAEGAGQYHAVDQFPVLAAYARVSDLPLAVVIEETLPMDRAAASWLAGASGQRLIGRLLTAIGILLVGGLIAGALLNRRVRKIIAAATSAPPASFESVAQAAVAAQTDQAPAQEVPATLDSEYPDEIAFAAPPAGGESEMEQAIRETAPEQAAAPSAAPAASPEQAARRAAMETVRQFEIQARLTREPKIAQALLAEAALELSGSPAIFFNYHPGVQAALTQTHAGFAPGDEPGSMSFPVDDEALLRVIQSAREGRIAAMNRYEPLARLILARLGIAHFEAWGVTSYTHPRRGPRDPKLLGVLVIAPAGGASEARREALARLILSAGMILGDQSERTTHAQPAHPRAASTAGVAAPGPAV